MLIERVQSISLNGMEGPSVRKIYVILLQYHYRQGVFVRLKQQQRLLYRVITYILTHSDTTLQHNMFMPSLFP